MMQAPTQVGEAGDAVLTADHVVHSALESEETSTSVRVIGALSEIGDQPQLRLVCGALFVLALVRKDVRLLTASARMILAHEAATAAKNAVKDRVDRRRPRSARNKAQEAPRPGAASGKEETSFPSGHSAGSMAVACAFCAVYPEYRAPALLSAGTVALVQVPRGAHYLSDVGAGLAIGAAASGLVGAAWQTVRRLSAPWWR